jgi:alpha-L-fucosidase
VVVAGNWYKKVTMADTIDWFRDAKFGLFLHFGLPSMPAGVWDGKVMGRNGYAEWIRVQHNWPAPGGISRAEYDRLIPQLTLEKFDADLIIREAAAAGMKYLVVTTKHHDGFALWRTKIVAEYSIDATPCGRDMIAELVAACRKHGLKVGFYYSHWLDWEHPGGGQPPWPEKPEDPPWPQPSDEMYEKYWTEKCLPQVSELITMFDPDLFWFDSWESMTKTRDSQLTEERLSRLIGLVRKQSPRVLINSRIGTEEGVDFLSMDDNYFPDKLIGQPWETSGTMNESWGYHKLAYGWKSPKAFLRNLINNVSRNGNYQLNIGPMGDGSLQPASVRRLRELSGWMSVNGEAIYGTRPVDAAEPAWGRLVGREGKIYAHVFDWPVDGRLVLPKLPMDVKRARVLESGQELAVSGGVVGVPREAIDDRVTVIELW